MILTETEEHTWKKAIHLLRIRDYSSYALKSKLLQKGHNISLVDSVLHQLKNKGFINDENLARTIVSKSLEMNYGNGKIRLDLEKRGIPEEISQTVLAQIITSYPDEKSRAQASLSKKMKRTERPQSKADYFRWLRLNHNHLARHGFSEEIIQSVLNKYIPEEEE